MPNVRTCLSRVSKVEVAYSHVFGSGRSLISVFVYDMMGMECTSMNLVSESYHRLVSVYKDDLFGRACFLLAHSKRREIEVQSTGNPCLCTGVCLQSSPRFQELMSDAWSADWWFPLNMFAHTIFHKSPLSTLFYSFPSQQSALREWIMFAVLRFGSMMIVLE